MSRRLITLLERVSRVREMIDREQRSNAASPVRLIRMKQLYLRLSENLRRLTKQQLIRMASAPRFRSERIFYAATPARSFSGRY
ncbi:hypothetical protein [Hyphomicrobium sp. 99]|uniref:hypothetical protein n=1 Tax=Hyphomicrobium sp. 99 TaxID=1163419 RepID=UPI0005F79509|nr:hypothetical protein [Hyphomicrobium sp. 99]